MSASWVTFTQLATPTSSKKISPLILTPLVKGTYVLAPKLPCAYVVMNKSKMVLPLSLLFIKA